MAWKWSYLVLGRNPRRTLLRAAVLAVVSYGVFRFVWRPVWVDGDSMEPTIPSGTLRWANLARYWSRAPETGDIVVVRIGGDSVMYLKRILAVPGERIAFSNGVFYVNRQRFAEPYVTFRGGWTTREYTLEPGEYYVAGDNRSGPIELHATGVVHRRQIAGELAW